MTTTCERCGKTTGTEAGCDFARNGRRNTCGACERAVCRPCSASRSECRDCQFDREHPKCEGADDACPNPAKFWRNGRTWCGIHDTGSTT